MTSPAFLDPTLHQPVRTQLVAFLAARGSAGFSELKRVLGITDGNLGAHLHKMIEAGYVSADASSGAGRAQTRYALTPLGRQSLQAYVQALQAILDQTSSAVDPAAQTTPGVRPTR